MYNTSIMEITKTYGFIGNRRNTFHGQRGTGKYFDMLFYPRDSEIPFKLECCVNYDPEKHNCDNVSFVENLTDGAYIRIDGYVQFKPFEYKEKRHSKMVVTVTHIFNASKYLGKQSRTSYQQQQPQPPKQEKQEQQKQDDGEVPF